jgi:Rrf2 family protein
LTPFIRDPLPTTFHYAVLALVGLHGCEGFLQTRSLAFRYRLPEPTLAKVLRRLTLAGILESARGASGGYRLTMNPMQISLLDVLTAVHELDSPRDEGRVLECCPSGQECPSLRLTAELTAYMGRLLEGRTLASLLKAKPVFPRRKVNLRNITG